jgi:hypothetical protein
MQQGAFYTVGRTCELIINKGTELPIPEIKPDTIHPLIKVIKNTRESG